MKRSRFEVWEEPWFGYTVVERLYDDGLSCGYRFVRNWIGMHKFFFTRTGAELHAAALNATKEPTK